MSGFFSALTSIPGLSKGTGGGAALGGLGDSSSSGPATNSSVNILGGLGASGGSNLDVLRIIQATQGNPYNGGYSGVFTGGIAPNPATPFSKPGIGVGTIVLLGVAGLVAYYVLR